MTGGAVMRGLAAAGADAAAGAVVQASAALAARAAAQFPDVEVEAGPDAVWLRGRGLQARVFGSRGRAADERFRALVTGDGR